MIIGIGTDIIQIERIRKAIEKDSFRRRVYTSSEQDYAVSRKTGEAASLAARFAGKEAILKALGIGLREGSLLDIEILVDDLGTPIVKMTGKLQEFAQRKGVRRIWLSLSHEREFAVASCVLEG